MAKKKPVKKTTKKKLAGDYIADFTEATGIKALVDALVEDCGCKDRQEALNSFHENALNSYNNSKMLNLISDTYTNLFGDKVGPKQRKSQCAPCHKNRIKRIRQWVMMEKAKSKWYGK